VFHHSTSEEEEQGTFIYIFYNFVFYTFINWAVPSIKGPYLIDNILKRCIEKTRHNSLHTC
jgi:hypothetical protein